MIRVKVRFSHHAAYKSMPDEGIAEEEVLETMRKSERTASLGYGKFKFMYRDLEVVALREKGYWLVVTCYRLK